TLGRLSNFVAAAYSRQRNVRRALTPHNPIDQTKREGQPLQKRARHRKSFAIYLDGKQVYPSCRIRWKQRSSPWVCVARRLLGFRGATPTRERSAGAGALADEPCDGGLCWSRSRSDSGKRRPFATERGRPGGQRWARPPRTEGRADAKLGRTDEQRLQCG